MENISADIQKFIEKNVLSGDVTINADTVLEDVGVDSFSIVEIILFIERKFGVVIPNDKLLPATFRTVNALTATVQELLQ